MTEQTFSTLLTSRLAQLIADTAKAREDFETLIFEKPDTDETIQIEQMFSSVESFTAQADAAVNQARQKVAEINQRLERHRAGKGITP
jgi:uncharacterized protein YceH (UPF0502 family)